ncbi:MAG: hypothetical protein ACI81Q_001180, partial [Paracoccaceae bacterium]
MVTPADGSLRLFELNARRRLQKTITDCPRASVIGHL